MKQGVAEIFPTWSTRFEGRINHMYLDVKGLVTIGIGNLIDPISLAIQLPFYFKGTETKASAAAISGEWSLLKGHPDLAKQGHKAAARITKLYLKNEDIARLVAREMLRFEAYLRKGFKLWDMFPADAQLGILSMAWAMGAGFYLKFPAFTRACNNLDWDTAAIQCLMRATNNPGLVPRNHANVALFKAAAVTRNPEVLSNAP